jgi:rhodanese-related sulfurtransferase
MFGMGKKNDYDLDSKEFESKYEASDGAVLVDVRTPPEFSEGHLPGAVNIDIYGPGFMDEVGKLDKSAPTFLYCRSGNRSGTALRAMQQMGFAEVYHLERGIIDWHGEIER